jgi:hypothetical protein
MRPVTALYCTPRSVYHTFPHVQVYDQVRDARTFPCNTPVVAHPPCRLWGRLRTFAKHHPGERTLAIHAVAQILRCGGVLEHPAHSSLWSELALPRPGDMSQAPTLWSLDVLQSWWGHRAPKRTWLLFAHIAPHLLPPWCPSFVPSTHVIGSTSGRPHSKECNKSERNATPPAFASFLLACASQANGPCAPHPA